MECAFLGLYIHIAVDMTPRHEIHLAVEGIWLETVTVDMTPKHGIHLAVEEMCILGIVL